MASIDLLIPFVQGRVAAAPKLLIRNALTRSARNFFRQTLAWEHKESGVLLAGESTVALTIPESTVSNQIKELIINGKGVLPLSEEWLELKAGHPTSAYLSLEDTTLHFNRIAQSDTGFSVRLSIMPDITGQTIDTSAVNSWGELIADGAAGELMEQPGKAWSDPAMSQHLKQRFDSAIHKEQLRQANGAAGDSQTVQRFKWV